MIYQYVRAVSLMGWCILWGAMSMAQAQQSLMSKDIHSFANIDQMVVKHIYLNLDVVFSSKEMRGFAELTLERKQESASQVVLDTRDLEIFTVDLKNAQGAFEKTSYRLSDNDPVLGRALTIDIPISSDTLRIYYRSTANATGVQWLTPEQTAGKQHPFMFTQAQAIHARSFIPLQDSPAVRATYSADIRVKAPLKVMMSAAPNKPIDQVTPDANGMNHFSFAMPQAIPSYLIALGVGMLEYQDTGPRTGVYAERDILPAAAKEFADTEAMMVATEQLYGPYRWDRYDLLILPPSFPFGGMENPRLSFITPTVIAGDKSLVNLIAHELAHSWSGNLVTNATWRDLWLNEGFTSYVENRIMEAVYGERRAVMEQVLSVQDLEADFATLDANDQILAIDLKGRDPDDVFSSVPYVKGQLFLMYLEQKFGRERFDQFLRSYFDNFAFQSITTFQFIEYLKEQLLAKSPGVVDEAQLNQWIFQPALVADAPSPQSDAFTNVKSQSDQWVNGSIDIANLKVDSWSVHEWLYFINNLPESINISQLEQLDKRFNLTQSKNNEIAHAWLLLAINKGYEAVNPRLKEYLASIGRRKLIVPLYKALLKTTAGTKLAVSVYEKARPTYHPLAQGTIDDLLKKI